MRPSTTPLRPLPSAAPPEVAARLDEALRATRPEGAPDAEAEAVYRVLVAHGFGRGEVLQLASSLVALVTDELERSRR